MDVWEHRLWKGAIQPQHRSFARSGPVLWHHLKEQKYKHCFQLLSKLWSDLSCIVIFFRIHEQFGVFANTNRQSERLPHHVYPPWNVRVNILLTGCWPDVVMHRQKGAAPGWPRSKRHNLQRTRPLLLSIETQVHIHPKKWWLLSVTKIICSNVQWINFLQVYFQVCHAALQGRSTLRFLVFQTAKRSCFAHLGSSYKVQSLRWELGPDPMHSDPKGECF